MHIVNHQRSPTMAKKHSFFSIPQSTLKLWLLVAAYAYSPLASFVSGVFHQLPVVGSYSDFVVPAIFVMLILLNFRTILRVLSAGDVLASLLFISVILLSLLLNPSNNEYVILNLKKLLMFSAPYYFVGLMWNDDRHTFEVIYKVSVFVIIVEILYFVLITTRRSEFNYSMPTAYATLPSVMVCLWWFAQEHRCSAALMALMGGFFLLFLGARGPVVVLILYIVVLFWNQFKWRGKTAMVLAALLLISITSKSETIIVLARTMSDFASKLGFSTRFFDFLLRNELLGYTSGRDIFYSIVREKIAERPIWGYGIYGEWQFLQNPAHRIWLEIWCHYGLIFGSVLIVCMLITVYRGIQCSQNEYIKSFIIIWAVHLCVRGIFGSSYLDYYSFFLWGLCINQIRKYQHM